MYKYNYSLYADNVAISSLYKSSEPKSSNLLHGVPNLTDPTKFTLTFGCLII